MDMWEIWYEVKSGFKWLMIVLKSWLFENGSELSIKAGNSLASYVTLSFARKMCGIECSSVPK
jgi:hypothetical protein